MSYFSTRNPYDPYFKRNLSTEFIHSSLVRDGIMGEDTPAIFTEKIAKLYDCIINDAISLKNLDLREYIFIEDKGLLYNSFGNAGGGAYAGDYRSFLIGMQGQYPLTVSISVFGLMKTTNDKTFGNRKGTTALVVAIGDQRTGHSSLQMTLDTSILNQISSAEFVHNGKLTCGKKGSISPDIVKNYIRKNTDLKVDFKGIHLGTISNYSDYRINDNEVKRFLSNLIIYALKRDEIRYLIESNKFQL